MTQSSTRLQEVELDLETDGVCILRGAISPALVEELKKAADHDYALIDEALLNLDQSAGSTTQSSVALPAGLADLVDDVARTSAGWGGIVSNYYILLARPAMPNIVLHWEAVLDAAGFALGRARGGKPARFRSDISYIRRHKAKTTHVSWHVDAIAAGTAKFDPVFNVWLPFVPVGPGTDRASLEFCRGSHKITPGTDQHLFSPDWIAAHTTDADLFCPSLSPGDIAIFNHWTLHRTQPHLRTEFTRASAELRFTADPAAWLEARVDALERAASGPALERGALGPALEQRVQALEQRLHSLEQGVRVHALEQRVARLESSAATRVGSWLKRALSMARAR